MNSTEVPLEVQVVLRDLVSAADVALANAYGSAVREQDDFEIIVEDEVFENQRMQPFRDYSGNFLTKLERGKFSDRAGVASHASFPEVSLPPGWSWAGDWQVDHPANTDQDGWQYGFNFLGMDWPPKPGQDHHTAMATTVRRRRWFRRRRRMHRAASTPGILLLFSSLQPSVTRRAVTDPIDAWTAGSASELPPGSRVESLGILLPGERVPLPSDCFSMEVEANIRLRPVGSQGQVGWSAQANVQGPGRPQSAPSSQQQQHRSIVLSELEDGRCILLCCSPSGSGPARQAGLQSFYASAVLEGVPISMHTRYGPEIATDWLINVLPPLVVSNTLPTPASLLLLSESGTGGAFEATLQVDQAVPVHSLDPRAPVLLKYDTEGLVFDDPAPVRLEPVSVARLAAEAQAPVLLSCSLRGERGTSLPQLVSGLLSCQPLVQGPAWAGPSQPGASSSASASSSSPTAASVPQQQLRSTNQYLPLQLRLLCPISIENRSDLSLQLAVVSLGPVERPESSMFEDLLEQSQHSRPPSEPPSVSGRQLSEQGRCVDVTDARAPLRSSPVSAVVVQGNKIGMASYPVLQDQESFGVQIRVEGSGWSAPIPVSHVTGAAASGATLLRLLDHQTGFVRELLVTVSTPLDRGGSVQEGTRSLRVEPMYLVSNRSGVPLFLRDLGSLGLTLRAGENLRPLHFSGHALQTALRLGIEPSEQLLSNTLSLAPSVPGPGSALGARAPLSVPVGDYPLMMPVRRGMLEAAGAPPPHAVPFELLVVSCPRSIGTDILALFLLLSLHPLLAALAVSGGSVTSISGTMHPQQLLLRRSSSLSVEPGVLAGKWGVGAVAPSALPPTAAPHQSPESLPGRYQARLSAPVSCAALAWCIRFESEASRVCWPQAPTRRC